MQRGGNLIFPAYDNKLVLNYMYTIPEQNPSDIPNKNYHTHAAHLMMTIDKHKIMDTIPSSIHSLHLLYIHVTFTLAL